MKKMISFGLVLVLMISMCIPAFASEVNSYAHDYNEEEYFRFKDSVDRMSSTGEFEFYCNDNLTSDKFIANADEITITASAKIYNRNNGNHTTSTMKYTITVHEVGGSNLSPVLTGKLNGKSVSTTVSVEKGKTYQLIIESVSNLDAVLYMDGVGSVSPVTRVTN